MLPTHLTHSALDGPNRESPPPGSEAPLSLLSTSLSFTHFAEQSAVFLTIDNDLFDSQYQLVLPKWNALQCFFEEKLREVGA